MAVPTTRAELSTVDANNPPAPTDSIGANTGPDDYHRSAFARIAENYADIGTLTSGLAAKAPIANPTFTGTPAAPTAAADTNTTQLATTAFVIGQAYAKLASPTFTGNVNLPATTIIGTVDATELSYVNGVTSALQGQIDAKAALASPTFSGTVTLPAVTAGGTFSMTNQRINAARTLSFNAIVDNGNSGTSKAVDLGQGQYQKMTMTGNCEITLTAPEGPGVSQVELTQDATGSRTYTTVPALKWPASYSATDKALSTAAGARDLLLLRWNDTDYVASLIKGIA